MFAKGHQQHSTRIKNRAHTHGDSPPGDIAFTEEIACCIHAGDAVKGDEPRATIAWRAGLIESNMSGATNTQDLQINTARVPYGQFIASTKVCYLILRRCSVRKMDVGGIDINVFKEMLLHEASVALQLFWTHRPVLIKIEGDCILEGERLFAVHAYQFVVHALWCRSGGQPQHGHPSLRGAFAEQCGDLCSHGAAGGMTGGMNADRYAFTAGMSPVHVATQRV